MKFYYVCGFIVTNQEQLSTVGHLTSLENLHTYWSAMGSNTLGLLREAFPNFPPWEKLDSIETTEAEQKGEEKFFKNKGLWEYFSQEDCILDLGTAT